jgi:hypothetical protein
MEVILGIAFLILGIRIVAWFVNEILAELLFDLFEMLIMLLSVLFRWLWEFLKWLWEWTCELSPYVGEAIVVGVAWTGYGAFWCGKHAWHGLSAAAVFLFYVLDEVVRDGHPDQEYEDEDAYADNDEEEDGEEDEEEDEDVYEIALQLLGLRTGCTREEFRRAYKHAISRAHPDKGGTHEQALAINTARKIITSQNGWTR